MIRLSFHTGGLVDKPLAWVIPHLAEIGYRGVEIVCGPAAHIRPDATTDELDALRRLLEHHKDVLNLTASECMTANPKTIRGEEFATTALNIMEQKKITSLVVIDAAGNLEGIVHLHDLWGTEMV